MEKCFCIGLAIGMMSGAVLAVNSYKVRQFIKESQKQFKDSVEKITEEKQRINEKQGFSEE